MKDRMQKIHDDARSSHIPIMLDDGMDFLLRYIEEHEGIRDILEIGTAVGYSSIRMSQIRWDMKIDTVEVNPDMYEQAVENIRNEGLSDRIHVHLCDGAEFQAEKIYDLIFIDAAKSQYRRYLEHFYQNARKGTVFIFDNLNFHGMVDEKLISHNRGTIQMVHKIKKFRDHLMQDTRFETVFYNETGDGIAVSIRKD